MSVRTKGTILSKHSSLKRLETLKNSPPPRLDRNDSLAGRLGLGQSLTKVKEEDQFTTQTFNLSTDVKSRDLNLVDPIEAEKRFEKNIHHFDYDKPLVYWRFLNQASVEQSAKF